MFQTNVPIESEFVAKILDHYWKLQLGKRLKISQNHTFEAYSPNKHHKFSVRVVPDPHGKHLNRIKSQTFFVNYLSNSGLNHICRPIPPVEPSQDGTIVKEGSLIIVVFEWAQGDPLALIELHWLTDYTIIKSWGRFLAQMHDLSRKFEVDHPEVASKIQRWNQFQNHILEDVTLHPDDEKQLENPANYGVIHGDLNFSNFYYVSERDHLSVFDTDQVQRGFYLFDISHSIFMSLALEEAGFPITGTPVPQANRKKFEDTIVAGYESIAGQGSVDRARLDRMVSLTKQYFRRFFSKAVQQPNIPPYAVMFGKYIINWVEGKKE